MVLYAVACDDVGYRTAVGLDGEQQRPENRPLRNADVEFSGS